MPTPKFNYIEYSPSNQTTPSWIDFIKWMNRQLRLIGQQLQGARHFDWSPSSNGVAVTIKPYLADLNYLTLTGNVAITLDTQAVQGEYGELEVLQDSTGGRVPTWVNAANVPSNPSGTASKKTLYGLRKNATGWIVVQLLAGY